ncbi:MAG: chromosome segregation protein [Herbinix sp.]|jgi:DNA repair exonuclease SbcCD ATPase subunit|nr:chromosome segregation protein [Herbinix sp.]
MATDFEAALQQLKEAVSKMRFRKETLLNDSEKLQKDIDDLKIGDYDKAAILMNKLANNQRAAASEQLSKLGTMALQYTFGPNYEMQIEMAGTLKKPKADIWFIQDGKVDEREDPMEDNGGGVVDIIGSSMRVVIMDNYSDASKGIPYIDGPILFDEPFKMVSSEYIPQMSEFISNVAKDFNRQVIAVTHNDYLSSMTDSNIFISLDENKRSVVVIQKNKKEE